LARARGVKPRSDLFRVGRAIATLSAQIYFSHSTGESVSIQINGVLGVSGLNSACAITAGPVNRTDLAYHVWLP
jgi:hypothetical protein